MEKIKISDVTLKEAAASGDYALSFREKIEIAKLLNKINASVIELPTIKNEKSDVLLIKSIASCVANSTICVPVNLDENDVERIGEALKTANKPRIQVAVPTSTVQMEFICKKKPAKVLEMITDLVLRAKAVCDDVEFVADDATRTDEDFLYQAIEKAIDGGATTVTVCDTAGIMLPDEFAEFIDCIYENVPAMKDVNLGVQCSNELSMACASTISALRSGASVAKVTSVSTVGAATMESVCQVIRIHGDDYGMTTDVKMTEFQRTAKQIDWIANSKRSKTSPFENGVQSYSDDLVLSEHDTIAEVAKVVSSLGYDLSDEDNANVFEEFKRISKKKNVGAKELDAIVASVALQVPTTYFLESYVINSGNIISATANITLTKQDEKISGLCGGDGPIDASFLAIEQIIGHHYELDDFQIQSVTEGKEAMGSALVKLRSNGRLYSGKGISTDIIGASIRAYLNALNKIVYEEA